MKLKQLLAVLFVICLTVFPLAGCSNSAEAPTDGEKETVTDQASTPDNTSKAPTYKMNDAILIKSFSGEYKLKVTGVEETKERNEYSDKKADRVVIVTFEYENISVDGLVLSSHNFRLYDKQGNELQSYPIVDTLDGDYIAPGEKSKATMALALNSKNNYIKANFFDELFGEVSATIELKW